MHSGLHAVHFLQQNGISLPKGDRHDFSDGWDRTKWFQSKGRNAEVWLKSKRIQERNSSQSIVLWISFQWEIRSETVLQMTTQKTLQLFYKRDLPVSKKIQVYIPCLVSEPMTIELIILFFIFQRALIQVVGNKKFKKWN